MNEPIQKKAQRGFVEHEEDSALVAELRALLTKAEAERDQANANASQLAQQAMQLQTRLSEAEKQRDMADYAAKFNARELINAGAEMERYRVAMQSMSAQLQQQGAGG